MLKHPDLTLGRLTRFKGELEKFLYPEEAPLTKLLVYSAPDRISYADAIGGDFRPAKVGESFGPFWSTHWFQIEYAIPEGFKGKTVLLNFSSTSEGCVWQDGVPLQGLTSYDDGMKGIRSHFPITRRAEEGETGNLYVEVAINGVGGIYENESAHSTRRIEIGRLRQARLVTRDAAVWELLWDFTVIKELAERLPKDGPHQGHALRIANSIVNAVILGDSSTYPAGSAIAREFFASQNGPRNHHVSAIGHGHLDTAWLWPVAETKRKCYRTFSTAIKMMDDYPEYKFACSQALQLAWIKEGQPGLYARIQEKARSGQFVPAGGTWIEPDCNIPSGESLVRQFLFGQRFFKGEFGEYCREFWNPDVFGYSGSLPQIMLGAGIRFFLTQKLSWNQFNRPTSSTLLWEGIDGSRVLTHFPPTDTYNSTVSVEHLLRHYTNFKDKDRANESYMLFGYGDGGGGPTEEMLERLRRLNDVPGLPDIAIRTPQEFFQRCEKDIVDPIVWSGELYFEYHRGTYTTQAANKRDNRRGEEALHDLEFLAATDFALNGENYPHGEINRLWKTLLLNQFHDIIPGSSIKEVYEDSAKDYADLLGSATALHAITAQKLTGIGTEGGSNVFALNTLSWPRREVVTLPEGKGVSFAAAPAYGYAVAVPVSQTDHPALLQKSDAGFTLENSLVCAKFDPDGRLTSFFDKRHRRESISAGAKANQFVLFEDKPSAWDAWDVDIYHLEKRVAVGKVRKTSVVEANPLRAIIELEVDINPKCTLIQRISLSAESPRLDFECRVDWQESEQFLKVEFPLALRSDYATYEIQFGHVRRPTHFNTTWDFARFEVSAHRWADLSEPGYGVALLNDSKYGYACHENVLRLSLLRAPKYPDQSADIGEHRFRYALFPHENSPQLGGVISEAAAFNQPLQIALTDKAAVLESFFSLDNPAIVLDTVKKAEDSDDLIVRLYESHGGHQSVTLTLPCPPGQASYADLLEQPIGPVPLSGRQISLTFRPFEIVTLGLSLRCSAE
jgi:alpha-mannosidase